MGKDGAVVSSDVLVKICTALDCTMDDIVEIEFRDLDYAARSKDAMMYKPRYIVQNADFLALHPVSPQRCAKNPHRYSSW